MKRILLICAMVALVGCGQKETQPPSPPTPATPQAAETQAPELTPKPAGEPVQEESLVGTYQVMLPNGTFTLILLEDGKVMVEQVSNAGEKNPENSGRGTWIAKNGEVVVTGGDTEMLFKINPNGTLTAIANITNGKREDVPKELQKLMVLSKPLAVPVTGESEATVGGAPKAEPPKAKVKKPLTKEESAKVIEAAIRKAAKKPAGELTKADYEKVTRLRLDSNQLTDVTGLEKLTQLTYLFLDNNQLTDVKGLEKLTKLRVLGLYGNPDLTKAQIDELKKALPKCDIFSNPTK